MPSLATPITQIFIYFSASAEAGSRGSIALTAGYRIGAKVLLHRKSSFTVELPHLCVVPNLVAVRQTVSIGLHISSKFFQADISAEN